jgi:hypothetical protein
MNLTALILAHMTNLFLCLIEHFHKGIHGGRGVASCILNLGSRWRQVVSFMPWLLYHCGKDLCQPIEWEARLPPDLCCMLRIEPQFFCCSSHSLVTMEYTSMISYMFNNYNSFAIRSCAVISSMEVLPTQGSHIFKFMLNNAIC